MLATKPSMSTKYEDAEKSNSIRAHADTPMFATSDPLKRKQKCVTELQNEIVKLKQRKDVDKAKLHELFHNEPDVCEFKYTTKKEGTSPYGLVHVQGSTDSEWVKMNVFVKQVSNHYKWDEAAVWKALHEYLDHLRYARTYAHDTSYGKITAGMSPCQQKLQRDQGKWGPIRPRQRL